MYPAWVQKMPQLRRKRLSLLSGFDNRVDVVGQLELWPNFDKMVGLVGQLRQKWLTLVQLRPQMVLFILASFVNMVDTGPASSKGLMFAQLRRRWLFLLAIFDDMVDIVG